MKRSVQEIVELLVFGLIALLIGTGVLWLMGWVFDLVGVLFKFFAGLIWSLLRFIVPVAVGAAIVYGLVRLVQQQRDRSGTETKARSRGDAPSGDGSSSSTAGSERTPPLESGSGDVSPVAPGAGASESGPKATASEVWTPPQPSPPGDAGPETPATSSGEVGPSEHAVESEGWTADVAPIESDPGAPVAPGATETAVPDDDEVSREAGLNDGGEGGTARVEDGFVVPEEPRTWDDSTVEESEDERGEDDRRS